MSRSEPKLIFSATIAVHVDELRRYPTARPRSLPVKVLIFYNEELFYKTAISTLPKAAITAAAAP